MKLSSPDRRTLIFIGFFLGIYLGWMMLYEWVLHPWGKLDTLVINDSSNWALFILKKLNFPIFEGNNPTIRTIGIDGTHGLWIGDPCNGLTLFALFTSFILAYPGSWKHKLWFIPLGISLIHTMNIIRLTSLCIIVLKKPEWLEFNHTYLFQVLMYGFIFLLWYIWIKKFSEKPKSNSAA
ncbi:MAG TPA: archaeosortase/exosortase family protein [Bacteroidia bacterium]|nr:archaeosortase/exosortase family protein [Bacteroidia bacterium]